MTNLVRVPQTEKLRFQLNLDSIEAHLGDIGQSPYEPNAQFTKPTLFVAGSQSQYVTTKSESAIQRHFPNSSLVWLDTGHWVHAERPEEFVQTVVNFMKEQRTSNSEAAQSP